MVRVVSVTLVTVNIATPPSSLIENESGDNSTNTMVSSLMVTVATPAPILAPDDGLLRTAVNCSTSSADWSDIVATDTVWDIWPGENVTVCVSVV